ncbi:MAG: antibiotic biosynthesis monooxygenase [Desulfobacterales bacterium]|nr:antibiotic biosynthesis monooxygenase [Desulfobacterales bacterium]
MVNLIIRMKALPSKLDELLHSCRLLIERNRPKAGCLSCRIFRDDEDKTNLILEETWKNRSCLDAYFRSDYFSALIGAMKLLGQDYEIRIETDEGIEGIEAVQSARSKAATPDNSLR